MGKYRTQRLWTELENQLMLAMASQGYSGGDVAKKLHRTRCSVMGRAHRLGIQFYGKPPTGEAANPHKKKRNAEDRRNWKKPLREYTPKQQPGIEGRTVTRLRRLGPVVFKREGDWFVDGRGRMTVAEMAEYADFLEARR